MKSYHCESSGERYQCGVTLKENEQEWTACNVINADLRKKGMRSQHDMHDILLNLPVSAPNYASCPFNDRSWSCSMCKAYDKFNLVVNGVLWADPRPQTPGISAYVARPLPL